MMYSTNILLSLISTIFKTINSSVDETRKTLSLFNKDWNTYKTNWQKGFASNGFAGGVKSVFQSTKSVVSPEQIQMLRTWNNAVKHGCTNQETFNKIIANADHNTKMYFAGLNKGKGTLDGLKKAQNATKASTIGLTIAQTALNMAISMGLMAAISLAIKGFDKMINHAKRASEAADEAFEKTSSKVQEQQEELKTLDELISKYKELKKDGTLGIEGRKEVKELQNDIADLVGTQARNLDLVNGKLDDEIKKLDEISAKEAKNAYETATANYNNSQRANQNATGDDSFLFVDGYAYTGKQEKDAEKILKEYGFGNNVQSGGFFGNTLFVMDTFDNDMNMLEGAQEKADYLQSMIDVLEQNGQRATELYSGLISQRDKYLNYIDNQQGAANTLVSSWITYSQYSNEELSKITVDSVESFEAYRQKMIEAAKNDESVGKLLSDGTLSEKDLEVAVNDFMATSIEFSDWYKQWIGDVQGSTFDNKTIVSLDDLKNTSEGISTLQKAFKELSDDGYVTTDTISKIKEAVGDSVTNWSEYEQTLLSTTANSEEFSQALSELTYKMLENEFGADGLANATEEQIAAVLRENGVLQAEAVAHDISTKAKAKAELATKSLIEVTEAEIKELGLSKTATSDLVIAYADAQAKMTQIVSEEALKRLNVTKAEVEAVTSIAEAYNLISASRKRSSFSPENLFGRFSSRGETDSSIIKPLSDDEAAIIAYAKSMERIQEIIDRATTINYSSTSSSKNEALDKALKQAERLYKVHQNELDYIKDLESASANYAKNEEERLEIQDKIDEARKDYAQNQIRDIEHQIELLQNLEGEEVNVLEYYRRIQDIAHTEAQRLRTDGYDDNSSEIQELQNLWWECQEKIEETKEKILSDTGEIVAKANELLDGFEDVYTTLTDAAKEYNSTGYLSTDSLQAILELSPKYLGFLQDENGQLVLNEEALQKVIAAQTEEMAVQNALAYAKKILNAAEQNDIETLTTLTQITAEGSNATWDMAYATLALAKAVGTANGMDSGYFDSAASYIDKMQSLSKIAVNSISAYYKTLDESYISQKDALDQILELTQDLIKWEQEQIIESLEEQKEDYQEIINKKKELIQLTKKESDHEKSVAEKLQEIAKLQSRVDQLSLDDSREAQAQKKGLEEELNELQKELADDQADYAVDVQIDALDKELEAFEDAKDEEIKAQEKMLDSTEELYQAAISRIENDWDGLYQDLLSWNAEYGSTLQSDLVNAWDAASDAVQRYGSFVEAYANADNYTSIGEPSSSPSGDSVTSDKNPIVTNIVNRMKANSELWKQTSDETKRDELEKQNYDLGQTLGAYLGKNVYRDEASGVWWIDGKKLFDVYHTGGVVGNNPSLKQNEIMSVLEEGEMVLTKEHQSQLIPLMTLAEILGMRKDTSVDMTAFTSPFIHPMSTGLSRIPLSNNISSHEAINFNPEITVNINHSGGISDSDLKHYGDTVADVALDKLKESFSRRGVSTIGSAMLK